MANIGGKSAAVESASIAFIRKGFSVQQGAVHMLKHFHRAHYDDVGKLMRDCEECGMDFTDSAHIHADHCKCEKCTAPAHTSEPETK